jgi:hypothetical protein
MSGCSASCQSSNVYSPGTRMPYSTRDVRRAFTGKFGFDLDEGHRHPTFIYRREGRVVAKTHISHGSGRSAVTDGIISAMARQIGVTGPPLRDAIECTLTGDGLVQLILRSR